MSFEEFWKEYPRRAPHANPRRPAEKAWRAAVKRGTPEEIVGGARGYKTYTQRQGTDPKFVCMAVTFLNQDRWLEHAESSNLRMEDVI
tara:strand:+ start:679 stop:942 length:264 start_codon:yes stop_codon:yes gene_type:complete